MSWEHLKYEAVCAKCGHNGFIIHSSDDWGRSETSYEGFENALPNNYEVGRKRVGPRDMQPRCKCGSTDIRQGELIKSY